MAITACVLAALRMFGCTRRDLVGRNISSLVPQPFASAHQQILVNYVSSGKEVCSILWLCACLLLCVVPVFMVAPSLSCYPADGHEHDAHRVWQAPARPHLSDAVECEVYGKQLCWHHARAKLNGSVCAVHVEVTGRAGGHTGVTEADGGM